MQNTKIQQNWLIARTIVAASRLVRNVGNSSFRKFCDFLQLRVTHEMVFSVVASALWNFLSYAIVDPAEDQPLARSKGAVPCTGSLPPPHPHTIFGAIRWRGGGANSSLAAGLFERWAALSPHPSHSTSTVQGHFPSTTIMVGALVLWDVASLLAANFLIVSNWTKLVFRNFICQIFLGLLQYHMV